MNILYDNLSDDATNEALFNLYLYICHYDPPKISDTIKSAIQKTEILLTKRSGSIPENEIKKLNILKQGIKNNKYFENSKIMDIIINKAGLTAACFYKPDGRISIAFKGTGKSEWMDNGEGLSGISKKNKYIYYKKDGNVLYVTNKTDYASKSQVEALNYFNKIVSLNSFSLHTDIIVSGHSKGGNKAQFITINSPFVTKCFSFNGQGFSPEAIKYFDKQLNTYFSERKRKIINICSENDYVNVLGNRLSTNNFYIKSANGLHTLESMLTSNGFLREQCERGSISRYVSSVSEKLMNLPSEKRKYVTSGVMNIFQKYIGREFTSGNNKTSLHTTIKGISIALQAMFPDYF